MSDNNRIGDKCWYKTGTVVDEKFKLTDWTPGCLRMWSSEDCGEGAYPVAVVEDDKTACVHVVGVELVCFAAIPPERDQP